MSKYGYREDGVVLDEEVTFTITCTMRKRWAAQFVSMLQTMQRYGSLGCSREVTLYSDGDGDFRPKFKIDKKIPIVDPIRDNDGDVYYDAG